MELKNLAEMHALALRQGSRYGNHRSLYHTILGEQGRHYSAIVGPRGVGKTVLLRQLAARIPAAFYLSADQLQGEDLFDTARALQRAYRVQCLLVDEIHVSKDFSAALKRLYDFTDLRVVFTSSVSIALHESTQDLSRRVRVHTMGRFSYREYLFFAHGTRIPGLTERQLLDADIEPLYLMQESAFDAYLQGGLMPFSLEEPDVLPALRNVMERVLRQDVPSAGRLTLDELDDVRRLFMFIGRSEVDGVNYTSLSRNVGIPRTRVETMVDLLRKAFLLTSVEPRGTNVMREPKILMCPPYRLLFRDMTSAIGPLREDFLVETMRMRGTPVRYLKTNRGKKTPDYVVALDGCEVVVEVGGKGKGHSQFKGYEAKRRLLLNHPSRGIDDTRRPLFLIGLLEPAPSLADAG